MSSNEAAKARALSGGFDPHNGQWVHRGLDLSKPTETTPEEIEAFKGHYSAQFAKALEGLDWWFDASPEVLKRYRLYCSLTLRVSPAVMGNGTLAFYMLNGYERGVRYVVEAYRNDGLSRAQIYENIALAFVHAGPRGMQTVSRALEGLKLEEAPNPAAKFPEGWAPDIDAFKSGLDPSTVTLSAEERRNIEDWYMRTIGEIPSYVTFLANHRPKLLKTHRLRMENMLYVLPKQMWPTHMLYYHVMTRLAEGIRENVLLCKAWGVTKSDTLDVIGNALVYGQMEAATMIQREASDIFDGWED